MLSHTETLLHTNTFAHIFFFNTEQLNAHIAYPKTNRGAFTKDRVDTRSFYLRTFLHRHTFTWFATADPHLARKSSANMQICNFTHSFWRSRCILWERVDSAQTHIAIWPQCMTIDISWQRVEFCGHKSTLPGRPKEKIRNHEVCRCFQEIDPHLRLYSCHFTPAYINL